MFYLKPQTKIPKFVKSLMGFWAVEIKPEVAGCIKTIGTGQMRDSRVHPLVCLS